jgi:predicted nucleic acid-binding protein
MVFIDTDLAIGFLSKKKTTINDQAKKIMNQIFQENAIVKLTIFNFAELYRGVYISSQVAHNLRIIVEFTNRFQIIPFLKNEAIIYSMLYAELKQKGEFVGDFDELIASIVISNDDMLYTRNIEHFKRIKLLKFRNWEEM